ncbi:MAG: transporter [Planctomycetaceae bacterium]|nr:transporter [Planctomycetaceae bacterium]
MSAQANSSLSTSGRYVIVICAFLGWLFAGFHMAITSLAMQPAAFDLLARTGELDAVRYKALNVQIQQQRSLEDVAPLAESDDRQFKHWKALSARWFAWLQCAFLFGAASGGLFFGRLGDRIGRSKAMALSILTYSLMAAAGSVAQSPIQLLVLWYLACSGLGGMWPNGVSLVSEVLSSLSRPMAAGLIGTAANIGIFLMSTLAANVPTNKNSWGWVTQLVTSIAVVWPYGSDASFESWRWMFVVGAAPFVLGLFVLVAVPESPLWLATRQKQVEGQTANHSSWEVFQPPLLKTTLVGIALATVPMIGGWGSANWMVPWAGDEGAAANTPNLQHKANVQQARSLTGIVGSLLGGWIGCVLGRRRTYFLVSLFALAIAQYTFWFIVPTDSSFLGWVAALGFFSGIYFGWMPLFLPELFPTRVRSTGAGVSFNFGRILTAVTVFGTGALSELFGGDFAQMGRATSLIFALGMLAICLAPETPQEHLAD